MYNTLRISISFVTDSTKISIKKEAQFTIQSLTIHQSDTSMEKFFELVKIKTILPKCCQFCNNLKAITYIRQQDVIVDTGQLELTANEFSHSSKPEKNYQVTNRNCIQANRLKAQLPTYNLMLNPYNS